MQVILAVPGEIRLVVLGVLGALLGSLINLGAYRLAWNPRAIGPWWPAAAAPPRRWTDRLPILGWLGMRREAGLHGRGFWIRPMAIELALALGLPALYWWEVIEARLLPMPRAAGILPQAAVVLHAQYAAHLVLLSLLLLAALIDIDEKTIPDSVTLPGSLAGLIAATLYPLSMLPSAVQWIGGQPVVEPLLLTSPSPWPVVLSGFPHGGSLALGLGCWWLWCVALMPRTWYNRHGMARAAALCLARLARDPATLGMAALGVAGTAAIAGVWFLSGMPWMGLLTALVGLAAGGATVWVVRIVGTAVLRREAMGFGDVTLMAMIGAFLGWQSCLIIFFLAPLAGVVVGVLVLLLRREAEIPYGPFLCLATLAHLLYWPGLWAWSRPIFALGLFLPAVLAVGVVLLAVLLALIQLAKAALR